MASALTKATSRRTLEAIWSAEKRRLSRSCFGVDRVSGQTFERQRRYEFYKIQERLAHNFKPNGLLAIAKPKVGGGNRIICVPTVADRLIQFSLCDALRPDLGPMGLDNAISFGLVRRSNKGAPDARRLACRMRKERPWVYKADIIKFFDQLARPKVVAAITAAVRKKSLHPLLLRFVDTEIEDGFDRDWKKIVRQAGIRTGLGIRQGMPLSPYFAGMYLRDLDRRLASKHVTAIRYVDDIVAFFHSEKECLDFHVMLKSIIAEIWLSIGEPNAPNSKTHVFKPSEPAAFLGMEISPRAPDDYCLTIPQSCIDRVVCRFADLGSVAALVEKNVGLTELGSYFQSIRDGYLNAYTGAQNRDVLRDRMDAAAQKARDAVLREVFGTRLATMPAGHRKFVGLEF